MMIIEIIIIYKMSFDVCGTGEMDKTILIDKHITESIIKAENFVRKYKMIYEMYRIESFIHWPLAYISVNDLAKTGFYYTGKGDRVRCNFCDLEVYEWNAEDIPEKEHAKWAPNCPMIEKKTQRKCDNKPFKPESHLCDLASFFESHTIKDNRNVRFICECKDK